MKKMLMQFAIVLVVLAVVQFAIERAFPRRPAIPKAVAERLERLRADSATFQELRAKAYAKQRADSVRAAGFEREARQAQRRAKVLEEASSLAAGVADSLARAGKWKDAYYESLHSRAQLFSALAAERIVTRDLDSALSAERARVVTIALAEQRAAKRVAQLEDMNRELEAAAKKAGECRILPGIPCPSRPMAALAGAGATLLAVAAFAL